jgi:hypothetical protein
MTASNLFMQQPSCPQRFPSEHTMEHTCCWYDVSNDPRCAHQHLPPVDNSPPPVPVSRPPLQA